MSKTFNKDSITKEQIQKIIESLKEADMSISEEEIQSLFSESNVERASLLSRFVDKVNDSQSSKQGDKKELKKDIINENKSINKTQDFVNKKGPSSLAQYNRNVQLPKQVPDHLLDQIVAKYESLRDLSEQVATLEIENPYTGDDQYVVVSEPTETNWLRDVQESIGVANEYEKKYKVTQSFKKSGQPSLELSNRLV